MVLGTSIEGEILTLERLSSLGTWTFSSRKLGGSFEREALSPEIVYVGAHLPRAADRRFKSAVIDFSDLMTWAGRSGLQDEFGRGRGDVAVRLDLPANRIAEVTGARIALAHGWSTTGDGLRSRGIDVSVGFVVDAEEARDLDGWLRDFVTPLRHLLTFSSDQANEVTELRMKIEELGPLDIAEVETWYPRDRTLPSASHLSDFPVDAEFLGASFEEYVNKWFVLYQETGTVIDALLAPLYRPKTFVDNHFLNTVAAAEGYHRVKYRNKMMSRTAHGALVTRVVASVPEDDRAWLSERLEYSNEPTFRTRLEELHARASGIVSGVVGNASEFAEPIVTARNRLTHRGKGSPTGSISGEEIYRLMVATRFVLVSCILLDLGLDEDQVVQVTRKWRALRLFVELNRRARGAV